jgi:glycosyltransferase involved in cell wall biosynthesis
MTEDTSLEAKKELTGVSGVSLLTTAVKVTEQIWPENTVPVVSIFCLTYNHEDFISEAIEGFLMQETTFPVEIMILDDASNDRTQELLIRYQKKYPKLISLILQTDNQYSKLGSGFAAKYLKGCKGKYLAMCEGDDYWTDKSKLQMQYKRMEKSPDITICCTGYNIDNKYNNEFDDRFSRENPSEERIITLANWVEPYILHTCTSFIRIEYLKNEIDEISKYKNVKDIFYFCILLSKGPGVVLNKITTSYRLHNGGIWSLKSSYNQALSNLKTARDLNMFFKNKNSKVYSFYYYNIKGFASKAWESKKYYHSINYLLKYYLLKKPN